jgi:hypothetical protein
VESCEEESRGVNGACDPWAYGSPSARLLGLVGGTTSNSEDRDTFLGALRRLVRRDRPTDRVHSPAVQDQPSPKPPDQEPTVVGSG